MRDFKDRMNDVGCETFINVLYPELKRDINVDVLHLSAKYKTMQNTL